VGKWSLEPHFLASVYADVWNAEWLAPLKVAAAGS
jgi:hypothetical protein